MAYDVNNIIPVDYKISPAGLGYANFASAFYFALEAELPTGFAVDTKKTYSSLTEVGEDFASTTETYKAMSKWLGGIPATRSVTIYGVDSSDASLTETLNKARNVSWWFFTFCDASVYANETTALELAAWCEANSSKNTNCQTGTACAAIRDQNETNDIASQLTNLGYRFTTTYAHATDPYAGFALQKHYAAVNYQNVDSTITGEFKKSPGVASEDLSTSEYTAMKAKNVCFYSTVETQGSQDVGRWLNTITHSSYGEYDDDVINLAAFINNITVNRYNTLNKNPTKLGQDPSGQATLDAGSRSICEQYLSNGYLGPRVWTNPVTGLEEYTVGYEILTKPEDILTLDETLRDDRHAAGLRLRIFRKGAIHEAPVDINVY